MNDFGNALSAAAALVMSGDAELMGIVGLSLRVSLAAVFIAAAIGLPLGRLLDGPARRRRLGQAGDEGLNLLTRQ